MTETHSQNLTAIHRPWRKFRGEFSLRHALRTGEIITQFQGS